MAFNNIVILFIFLFDYSTCFLHSDYNHYTFNFLNKTIFRNTLGYDNIKPIIRQYPIYFDWRAHDVVSPIKNQKVCRASWAFGIAAHLESQYKLIYNVKLSVSEQFLIDCLPTSAGCTPGNIQESLKDLTSGYGGILLEGDYYPYSSAKESCRWNGDVNNLRPVTGTKKVFAGEHFIIDALLKNGPLIASINSDSMVNYVGGIDEPTDDRCDPKKLNHVVLIVGYDLYVNPETHHMVPYWIIKNSWGTIWGDNGFYYLVRGRNACGIESQIYHVYVS